MVSPGPNVLVSCNFWPTTNSSRHSSRNPRVLTFSIRQALEQSSYSSNPRRNPGTRGSRSALDMCLPQCMLGEMLCAAVAPGYYPFGLETVLPKGEFRSVERV